MNHSLSASPYIIAEIGNNHQGSLETAIKMVHAAKYCGVNAVKFQKRSISNLYTQQFFNSAYDNPNSFGKTYGEHRQYLELDIGQLGKLRHITDDLGLDFIVTPFDLQSLEELERIGCCFYKIASADLTFMQLIERISNTSRPIIISTGHSRYEDIDRALGWIPSGYKDLTLLHCTSSYPADCKEMNLNCITAMIKKYGFRAKIGLSDHENGIDAASIAYMLGARTFEKHFTLNRSWKGTDNAFSLEPEGMRKLVRNLHRISDILGTDNKIPLESEKKPMVKMRKCIVFSRALSKGHKILEEDLSFKAPGEGFFPYDVDRLIGLVLKQDVECDQLANMNQFL